MDREFDARTVDLLTHLGSTQGSKNVDRINIDAVQPTLEINQHGMLDPRVQTRFATGNDLAWSQQVDATGSLATLTSDGNLLVCPEGFVNPWAPSAITVTNQISTRLENTKVFAYSGTLLFNLAGSNAFAGKRVIFNLSTYRTTGIGLIFVGRSEITIVAGRLGYAMWPTGPVNQIVPWDCVLEYSITSEDGTAFPAATIGNFAVLCAVRPRNVPLPVF